MQQGIVAAQMYTVREFAQTPEQYAAALHRVRQMGYTAVETGGGPATADQLKAMLDAEGLALCGTHTGFERLQNDISAVIAEHKLWQCTNVGIPSMPGEFREGGEDAFRRFAKEATAIGKRLNDAGLSLMYHNHSFEFVRFGKRTGLDVILEESDPRYLNAEVDVYWVQHGGGDPAAWVRKVAGRMPVVHVKDMVIHDHNQMFAEIGEGNLNWDSVLQACRDIDVKYYVVEQDRSLRNPFESLEISCRFLKSKGLS
ncbi:MAG: sugar phosphate isomerase/epimerase family protein [Anaerolineae bacterium]